MRTHLLLPAMLLLAYLAPVGAAPVPALPPGAPVKPGVHPRLTVTREELALARRRAETEPAVRAGLDALAAAGASSMDPPVAGVPAHDSGENNRLIMRAAHLGYGALVTGRQDLARRAAEILLAYADAYAARTADREGRVFRYSLQEAIWLCQAAIAADLVMAAGVLSPAETERLVRDLLRPAAREVMTDRRSTPGHKDGHHQCYNFQAWHCAAVGLVGFLLEDPELVRWAVDGEYGFRHMVAHDIRDDGVFWERSPGYHAFVMGASARLCEAAARAGRDLWNLSVPDTLREDEWGSSNYTLDGDNGPKSFRMMFEAPLDWLFPNLEAAPISDSSAVSLSGLAPHLELAYTRTGSPRLAQTLRLLAENAPPAPFGWSTWAPEGQPRFSGALVEGRCVLAIENGSDADRGCWVSPRVRVPPVEKVTVRLHYRTRGVTAQKGAVVRVANYREGKADPKQFTMIPLKPSEEWTTAEGVSAVPAGTEAVGLEAFLWRAAGRVEVTQLAILAPDGKVLLGPDAFSQPGMWRTSGVLPWNLTPVIPKVPPLPADDTFGTTGLRRAGSSLFPATGVAILREDPWKPEALAALLNFGPYGGGHGHPAMLEMIVYGRGRTLLPGLATASYDSPLHGTWTNTTVAHNTVVVDQATQWPRSKWGHDTAERQVAGELLAFPADERLRLARARCRGAWEDVHLERTLAILDGAVLDVYRVTATDGKAHRFDYVLHGEGALSAAGVELQPRAALGDAEGYQHLSDARAGRTDAAVQASFGENLRLTAAPSPGTEVIAATGLGVAGTHPLPVLLLRRNAQETSYAVLFQAPDDRRPATVSTEGAVTTATIGGNRWQIDLRGESGAVVRNSESEWKVGGVGERTRRTGGGPARTWEPVRTGGVAVRGATW